MATTIIESLFQRNLEDLVKGLRVQMIGEARYIADHLEEIRKEIKSADAHTKTVALQKLTYINMLHGVDMEWAAFHVVEVMSMAKFAHKKVGYLAAFQSFYEGSDLLLLIANQLRKDLGSTNEFEAGLALDCLSCIATPDLARELSPEVFRLLANRQLYARKKATLVLLKLFAKYPDAVRIAFKRLVEKMEDPDLQVVSAAVSVLCEMTIKDPRSYLPLAPEFHRLLVDSKNNWLTIKIVKIFGVLAPLEPMLGRKIAEPLCVHMKRTGAKSLLLECIRTVIAGLIDHAGAITLAVEKLKELLEEDDPNLKYLGLQALASLMPDHPWAVSENKSTIIRSLRDEDRSIQMASLQLIMGMVSESNVIETVQILMQYADKSDPSFCNELIGAILATCSRGLYQLVPDFAWYVLVLGNIARIPDSMHGRELERQFVDIGMRVKEVRGVLLHVARGILLDPTLLEYPSLHRVLSALAWIAGEYVEFSQDPYELIEALLQPRTKLLPPPIQSVYLQAVLKVFVYFSFVSLKDSFDPAEVQKLTSTFSSLDLEGNATSKQQETDPDLTFRDNGKAQMRSDRQGVDMVIFSADVCLNGSIPTSMGGTQHRNASSFKGCFVQRHAPVSQQSLYRIMELIDLNVRPLTQSVDVEVQERACNLLGVVKALREHKVSLVGLEDVSKDGQTELQRAFEMMKFLRAAFSQELGPVSVFAQGRVAIPDELVLEENLDSLDAIFSYEDVFKEKGKAWSTGLGFDQRQEDLLQSGESVSLSTDQLLHGPYKLCTGKDVTNVDEYPPPRIAQSEPPLPAAASEDITKLAEQSLYCSTKPRRLKARSVVVRLDDAEEVLVQSVKSKRDLKDDFISSAIRDVLSGAKNKHSLNYTGQNFQESMLLGTFYRQHRKTHHRRHLQNNGTQTNVHKTVQIAAEKAERTPGKHRHSTYTKKLLKDLDNFEGGQSSKGRWREHPSRHRQLGQRSRLRKKSPLNLYPQTLVIPDFLL